LVLYNEQTLAKVKNCIRLAQKMICTFETTLSLSALNELDNDVVGFGKAIVSKTKGFEVCC
jgi:hypothetical protein|tara:strand:+ start:168 stop:350 length:183 start_codon:yes stop_codon:yes gene_type:complete